MVTDRDGGAILDCGPRHQHEARASVRTPNALAIDPPWNVVLIMGWHESPRKQI